MSQQHAHKVGRVRSGMTILKATLIVTLTPAVALAQPVSSNPAPVSTQAPTSASQLSPLSEANCKPSDNPKEEKPEFCGGIGDGEIKPIRINNPPVCHFEFGQGDWKTVCMIFQF